MFFELLKNELLKISAEAAKSSPHWVGKGYTNQGKRVLESFKDKGFYIPPTATVTSDTLTTPSGLKITNTATTTNQRSFIQTKVPNKPVETKAVNPAELPINTKPIKKMSQLLDKYAISQY